MLCFTFVCVFLWSGPLLNRWERNPWSRVSLGRQGLLTIDVALETIMSMHDRDGQGVRCFMWCWHHIMYILYISACVIVFLYIFLSIKSNQIKNIIDFCTVFNILFWWTRKGSLEPGVPWEAGFVHH